MDVLAQHQRSGSSFLLIPHSPPLQWKGFRIFYRASLRIVKFVSIVHVKNLTSTTLGEPKV